jgi:hypothetical protein
MNETRTSTIDLSGTVRVTVTVTVTYEFDGHPQQPNQWNVDGEIVLMRVVSAKVEVDTEGVKVRVRVKVKTEVIP